jgi:predicted nucleic acid-binding protein
VTDVRLLEAILAILLDGRGERRIEGWHRAAERREVRHALARRLHQGALTRDAARRVQRAIVGRLDDGAFRRVELTRDVHRRAEHFLLTRGETPLRAADALHLALATSGRAASMASFDARLGAAARAIGLATYPA